MARRGRPKSTQAAKDRVTAQRKRGVIIDLEVLGTNQVRKRLLRLKLTAGRNVVNRALRQACKQILKPGIDANINTISPGTYGQGKLLNNPTKVRKISKKRTHMGYGVYTASKTKLKIGADEAYYPAIIEVGGKAAGRYPIKYIEGRHMLKRARDQKSSRIKKFLNKVMHRFIDEEIEKIVKRDAGRVRKGKKALGFNRSSSQLAKFQMRGIL